MYRVTEVVGGAGPLQADGELRMGTMDMPAGLRYPAHHHPAPEIYVVLEGRLRWTVEGCDAREVGPGTVVIHRPSQIHAMETLDGPAKLLWMWWSPGGDTSVMEVPAVATEPWDEGPPTVG
jgi:quercetin dioxygenase-like cupin family protein